jgi:hypothetical protein
MIDGFLQFLGAVESSAADHSPSDQAKKRSTWRLTQVMAASSSPMVNDYTSYYWTGQASIQVGPCYVVCLGTFYEHFVL